MTSYTYGATWPREYVACWPITDTGMDLRMADLIAEAEADLPAMLADSQAVETGRRRWELRTDPDPDRPGHLTLTVPAREATPADARRRYRRTR